MTMRTILASELLRFGADYNIADKLLACRDSRGTTPLARWCVSQWREREYLTRADILKRFADSLTKSQIETVLYVKSVRKVSEIRKSDPFAYENLCQELHRLVPSQPLWGSLIPFAYNHVKELAIENMLRRGARPSVIAVMLNVSERKVYEVKKKHSINGKTRNV